MSAADPREEAWRRFIETSTRLSTAVDEQLRCDAGMSLADYHVLLLLTEAPQHRLRMKELSERMVFSASRLTYQIDVLCRRGWVRRERAAADRRGSFAVLTDEGASAFADAAVGHLAQVQRLFIEAFTAQEGRTLTGLLARLDAHLDQKEQQ
ncbi:MarR family winged helix-turn-helix transcriptional regulator [Gordonia sp. VNK21]|uniref:MarR family winged helix-turn-helix transcriptional regulator n=1 Tax=Gordonia sp. VNK21 TaxID=3382483 RepID=UPI0038D50526